MIPFVVILSLTKNRTTGREPFDELRASGLFLSVHAEPVEALKVNGKYNN